MKNIKSLAMIAALASMGDMMEYPYNTPRPKRSTFQPQRKLIPFNKRENILKLIDEYKSIKIGTCTKGKMKQIRTVNKIEAWVTQGYLTLEDIT